jgi:uncharacterized membrane protein YdjX (TVP38/TMEM64 family)
MSVSETPENPEVIRKKPNWKITVLRIAALIFVIALTISLFLFRKKIGEWTRELPSFNFLAYPVIFLVSILANATIILPVPGVVLTAEMGAVFNPILVAVAAGAGAAIGELTGYLAGFSGRGVIENRKWYNRVVKWMSKYGDVTILVMAIIPNPFFDIAGMVAGAMKMPWWRFMLWCTVGKIIKMLMFAYGGLFFGKLLGI